MNKIPIIAIVGPTASGKTGLSIEIAKKYNGEIISADSMQIYKKMDIGTAKPSLAEMQGIPHHCIDFLEPNQPFSVAQYVAMAHGIANDIHSRGKMPILVGGTGLYVSSFLNNINFEKTKTNTKIREELRDYADENGAAALHDRLKKIDPQSAESIHENNIPRVIRAIEVYELTGFTMTQQQEKSRLAESPYNSLKLGLNYKNRDNLYQKINQRVDLMIANGLVDETKSLLLNGIDETALQAIGYKELIPYIKGYFSLEEAVSILKQESRHYAKRQLSWFNRDKEIKWFYQDEHGSVDNVQIMQKNILNTIDNFVNMCYH